MVFSSNRHEGNPMKRNRRSPTAMRSMVRHCTKGARLATQSMTMIWDPSIAPSSGDVQEALKITRIPRH
jgi:hypothetical protein